jgi:predicted O-methyltransferase YrrM
MRIKQRAIYNVAGELNHILNCKDMVDTRDHLLFMSGYATYSKNVLEIGTDVGNTTSALLAGVEKSGGHLWSVDINPDCKVVYEGHPQWTFINRASDPDILTKIFGTPEHNMGKYFDLIYIDGDHSYQGVKRDLETAFALVKPSGYILMHDVLANTPPEDFPGVRRAFDEIVVDGTKVIRKYIRPNSYGLGVIQCG